MKDLLTVACTGAREAGVEIMKHYEVTDFEAKDDGSPVTIADKSSNDILFKYLKETNIPILSEESYGIPLPYPRELWIIDPLDGTKDFINKTGDFAVMVGLIQDGRPVLGAVYAPATNKLYYAMKGEGAFLEENGTTTRLSVSHRETHLRCLQSVHHYTKEMEFAIQKLEAESIPHGSVGIKIGFLAEDVGDFFFAWGELGEWDVCAPEIITVEAGGCVTDKNGSLLYYGTENHRIQHGMVFSNGVCHTRVLEALKEATSL